MLTSPTALTSIPVVDVRDGGPVRHAIEGRARAQALRDACLSWLPRALLPAVPLLDRVARRWLIRSKSPYVAEVQTIAAALGFPGIWFLNNSYQWCCTTRAHDEDAVPWLARTLDWPLPGIGRHIEVARMQGRAGDYFNVTWPGYVGVLTAMAPGRFGAAINQAPLWRRTRLPWLRPYDIAANGIRTWWSVRHVPPDQLLRQAFETCRTFAEAKALLEATPIARPVIYTLAGCGPGERCVIERTEEGHATREEHTSAANDWLRSTEPWEGRVGGDLTLVATYAEAGQNSRARRDTIIGWSGLLSRDHFAWVVPPVLNRYTRIAAEMCPARGVLRVVGYELEGVGEVPQPVTQMCEVNGELLAA